MSKHAISHYTVSSLVSVGSIFYIPAVRIYEGHIINVELILCFKDFGLKMCGGIDTDPWLNAFVSSFAKLRIAIIIFFMSICP
jgi:hypothetical protein